MNKKKENNLLFYKEFNFKKKKKKKKTKNKKKKKKKHKPNMKVLIVHF